MLKPLEALCTIHDTLLPALAGVTKVANRQSIREFFPTRQRQATGGTIFTVPTPCVGALGGLPRSSFVASLKMLLLLANNMYASAFTPLFFSRGEFS